MDRIAPNYHLGVLVRLNNLSQRGSAVGTIVKTCAATPVGSIVLALSPEPRAYQSVTVATGDLTAEHDHVYEHTSAFIHMICRARVSWWRSSSMVAEP